MVAKKWALLVVFLSSFYVETRAGHFRGATFQWRPIDAENFDGLVSGRTSSYSSYAETS